MTAHKKNFDAAAAKQAGAAFLGQRLHRELLKPAPGLKRLIGIIEAGAALETRNKNGETPLLAAIKRKHTNAALLLINADASVGAIDNDNRTPLYHAVDTGNLAVMKPLFAMNAPIGFTTDSLVGQDRWDDYLSSLQEKIAKLDAETPIRLMKPLSLNGNIPEPKATPAVPLMKKLKLKP